MKWHFVYAHYTLNTNECLQYGDKGDYSVSPETRAKMSKAAMGRLPWNKGKLSPSTSKSVINCRGQVFASATVAANTFGLKSHTGISSNINGKYKSSGKYSDGTKIRWSLHEQQED